MPADGILNAGIFPDGSGLLTLRTGARPAARPGEERDRDDDEDQPD
jgi:hypothetical protein